MSEDKVTKVAVNDPEELDVDTPIDEWTGPPEQPKSIYALFETDTTMEQQGIVVDFGAYGKFKIGRACGSNIKYTESFRRHNKPYDKMIRRGTMPENLAKQVTAKIYSESIVFGWEGVYDRKMKPIPFTRQNVMQVLIDLPDLFTQIIVDSTNAELYRKEYVEEATGNS